jgi:hypothetical protein
MSAAPEFYAARLGQPFISHQELLRARLPRALRGLAARPGRLRGLALGWLARRGHRVAVIRRERGSLPALLVCALPPARRRVFVLELIRRPLPRTAWRRVLYRLWWHAIENPALRRGMAAAQVMTAWEREEYANHYGIDRARVHHVPWPFCERRGGSPEAIDEGPGGVFASGRTACDWETLFAAAQGRGWSLTVVCSGRDRRRVRALAAGGEAEVHVDVAWGEHDRLLRSAEVCVIPIEDRGLSAGHVRLMTAVEAGIPVVATKVRSLDGYLVPGETAVVVPAADAEAMRAAIEALLADPERRRRIRDAALARARGWTYADYFARIATLVLGKREIHPAGPGSG